MIGTCDGCGTEHVLLVEVTLAPGVIVNLCASRSRGYYLAGFAPKIGCLRRAFEAAKCCPGCGQQEPHERQHPFTVCGHCRAAIDRNAQDGVAPTLYALDTKLLSTVYPSREAQEKATKVINALIRVAAAKGPRRHGHAIKDVDWTQSQVLTSDRRCQAHTGMLRVELDDDQRDAIVELGGLIRDLIDAMYLQGRKAGRDLLDGLAHGDISANDFTDRDLRWRAEEKKGNGDEE